MARLSNVFADSCGGAFVAVFRVCTTTSERFDYGNSLSQAMLRVCCLRRFGYFISCMKSVCFTYDATKTTFVGPQQMLSGSAVEDRQVEQKLVSESYLGFNLARDLPVDRCG
jgi:hypothetical protein